MEQGLIRLLNDAVEALASAVKSPLGEQSRHEVDRTTDYTEFCRRRQPEVIYYMDKQAGTRFEVTASDVKSEPPAEYAMYIRVSYPSKYQLYAVKCWTDSDARGYLQLEPLAG